MLLNLGQGYYRLNHYETRESQLKSYTNVSTGLEIPDNWVFIQDSSSSMGFSTYVNTGCRFDLLNLVKYGLMKGVYDAAKLLGKETMFGVVDFSDSTRYKGMDSLTKIYDAKSHPIKTLSLTPQCGGTAINTMVLSEVEKELVPGNTLWTIVTDGAISGCESHPTSSNLYKEIDRLSAKPDNSFVFVEINCNSALGGAVEKLAKSRDTLNYFSVSNVLEIQERLGKLLVKY